MFPLNRHYFLVFNWVRGKKMVTSKMKIENVLSKQVRKDGTARQVSALCSVSSVTASLVSRYDGLE